MKGSDRSINEPRESGSYDDLESEEVAPIDDPGSDVLPAGDDSVFNSDQTF